MKEDELIITRFFDSPREMVWKAWSEPERFMQWWGPKDFTSPICKINFREGGTYLSCMRSPDGKDSCNTGIYREIVKPERFIFTSSFVDESGNIVPASYYGLEGDFPLEQLITVILDEIEGKTKMTLRHLGIPSGKMMEMCSQGWNESFDKLEESLKNIER